MSQNAKGWVLVVGVLLIIGVAAYVTVQAVRNAAMTAVAPIQQGNASLQTQVASFLHPTPTVLPDPATIIHEVRTLARLESIQYSIEKVITAETNQGAFGFLFGDKLLLVAHGTVIAGVDLSLIGPEDISVDNGVVTVHLPPPEIFVATLNNSQSYVYNRTTGVLTRGDVNLETTARQAAESEIRKAAIQDGILKQAQTNAENYLSRLLENMGYKDVIFLESTPSPEPTGTPVE